MQVNKSTTKTFSKFILTLRSIGKFESLKVELNHLSSGPSKFVGEFPFGAGIELNPLRDCQLLRPAVVQVTFLYIFLCSTHRPLLGAIKLFTSVNYKKSKIS